MDDKRKSYRSNRPYQHIQLKPLLELINKELHFIQDKEDLIEMFAELELRLN